MSKKGQGSGMRGTGFLDEAGRHFPDDSDSAPYTGTFVAEESLSKVWRNLITVREQLSRQLYDLCMTAGCQLQVNEGRSLAPSCLGYR